MSVFTVTSLSKSLGPVDLFPGITFSVAKGARLALVRPNGVGKTTLLKTILGQLEPLAGKMELDPSLRAA